MKSLSYFVLFTLTFLSVLFSCEQWANTSSIEDSPMVFSDVGLPETNEDKRKIRSSKEVVINNKSYPIKANIIIKAGEKLQKLGGRKGKKETFGLVKNKFGKAVFTKEGKPFICRTSKKKVGSEMGSGPDYSSLTQFKNKLFMITQFECSPATAYLSELKQNKKTGQLKAISTRHIDFKNVFGGFTHCAGTISPWGTHLGSEEYEPNARYINSGGFLTDKNGSLSPKTAYNNMGFYFGGKTGQKKANPYYYGWITEIKIKNKKGRTKVTKHYSMGRFSHELAYVMPDKRTAYLSDDGTNCGFYMFIADRKGNLSSGKLYAAKWEQVSDKNGGEAKIKWVPLGHATDRQIRSFIKRKPKFKQIFKAVEVNKIYKSIEIMKEEAKCPKGYSAINTAAGFECLKVKRGMKRIASRLETRRYAAILGATTEFRKSEGITYNPDANKLYLAISSISKGMEKNHKKSDMGRVYKGKKVDDIRLSKNVCGAVYEFSIKGNARDSKNKKIKSKYVVYNMKAIITGEQTKKLDKKTGKKVTACSYNKIASPDNISYLPKSNILIIGEDTKKRVFNFAWAFNVKTKNLTRILTVPYGAEVTSSHWYQNINGWGYLMFVAQHPFSERGRDQKREEKDLDSPVGYIGPFPSLDKLK